MEKIVSVYFKPRFLPRDWKKIRNGVIGKKKKKEEKVKEEKEEEAGAWRRRRDGQEISVMPARLESGLFGGWFGPFCYFEENAGGLPSVHGTQIPRYANRKNTESRK